jgi:hypothetical protein
MELQVNQQYEFEVIDICSNTNGLDYLLVLGPDDKTYKVYNIIKCQYTSIPSTIYGIVAGTDTKGNFRIKQDECRVLQEHYDIGHFYAFKISDKRQDNNNKTYYVLEDDFSYQRWYSNEDYEIGDDIILLAKSISNNGYIFYEKHKSPSVDQASGKKPEQEVQLTTDNSPIFEGEDENQNIEYKTSIVFTPKHEANIDVQMFNIVRELAAFMNADGGTLYIGIHDKTRQIIGIENDLPHLCEGESPYAASYSADYDHYQLKIRDTLVSLCSTIAGSLIKISFPEQGGKTYCKIEVAPAKRPIWTKGNMLFQRQGNQALMLRGEAITQFVGERIGNYIVAMAGGTGGQDVSSEEMATLIRSAVKTAINDRRLEVAAPVTQQNTDPKYWIVWYNDGTWSREKTQSDAQNVFKQLPVTEDAADVVIAFCHKSGTVNLVKLSVFKKKTRQGEINKNGYNPNETPAEIYICHPSCLLAVHSADQGGTEYIKMHHLTDFNPTTNGRNQGSYIIPKGKGHVLEFKLITPEKAVQLNKLIAPKKDTSQSFGLDWNNVTIQAEISLLGAL